jgi:trk system potassium uptake protein TrkH
MPSGSRALQSLRFAARIRVLAYYLGLLLGPLGVLTCGPATVAWASGRPDVALYNLAVAGGLVALGALGWKAGRRAELQRNEALVLTALVFGIASLAGAIPLTAYGMTPLDAWVESVSGATTTGLSVLASLEEAPPGLLFARAWLQWIGGLGVLVLALALIVTPGVSAKHMGFGTREVSDVAGGTRAHARRVLVVYLALTLFGIGALIALGAGAFDATLHAFTAISTGGFASHDGSLAVFPSRVRVAILALCFAGAVPFSCYYRTLYQHPWRILSDPQLRSLALLCALSVAALAGVQWLSAGEAVPVADLAATAVSAQTTAGFSSVGMSQLAPGSKLIVIASMFVGGGLGSTAGGIKIFRLLVSLQILRLLLDQISIVRSGRAILRFGGDPVSPDEVEWVVGVVSAYGILVLLSWLAFLIYGYAPLDSLFEVVSAVGTVGLSTGITSSDLPALLKGVLSLDMLMGRVEVVAFIVLLRPVTWLGRRRSS